MAATPACPVCLSASQHAPEGMGEFTRLGKTTNEMVPRHCSQLCALSRPGQSLVAPAWPGFGRDGSRPVLELRAVSSGGHASKAQSSPDAHLSLLCCPFPAREKPAEPLVSDLLSTKTLLGCALQLEMVGLEDGPRRGEERYTPSCLLHSQDCLQHNSTSDTR